MTDIKEAAGPAIVSSQKNSTPPTAPAQIKSEEIEAAEHKLPPPLQNDDAPPPSSPLPLSSTANQRSLRQTGEHLWHGLPTAAKATLILAIASSVLLIAYGITAVSLRTYDEEAHISTLIIVMAIFILYATFDAVISENTLQLIIAIILSTLYKLMVHVLLLKQFCSSLVTIHHSVFTNSIIQFIHLQVH